MAKVAQNLPRKNTTSCTSHMSVVAAHTSIVTPVIVRVMMEDHLEQFYLSAKQTWSP